MLCSSPHFFKTFNEPFINLIDVDLITTPLDGIILLGLTCTSTLAPAEAHSAGKITLLRVLT